MFSRWLRRSNRLTHADANTRKAALERLDPEEVSEKQDTIVSLALKDADPQVRELALNLVQNPNAITGLLEDPEMAPHAAKKINAAVKRGLACEQVNHPLVVSEAIEQATSEDIDRIIAASPGIDHLVGLALRMRGADREKILTEPSLQTESALVALEKASRSKDKSCNRFARDQLEVLRTNRTACVELSDRIAELDESITKELKQNPDQHAEKIVHQQKLTKLAASRAQLSEKFTVSKAVLNKFAAATPEIGPDPLAQYNWSDAQDASQDNHFGELVGLFEKLSKDIHQYDVTSNPLSEITTSRDLITQSWLSLADISAPGEQEHQVFNRVSSEYSNLAQAVARYHDSRIEELITQAATSPVGDIETTAPTSAAQSNSSQTLKAWNGQAKKLLKTVNWPQQFNTPTTLVELQNRIASNQEQLDQQLEQDRKQASEGRKELEALAGQLEKQVTAGNSKSALLTMRNIRALQKQGVRNQDADKTINALSARLKDLQDWQKFATTPKRTALLEELQKIVETPLDPPDQIAKLKSLRNEWRQLGPIQSSEEGALQDAFNKNAEAAFSHCNEYFADQTKLREDNLANRQQLCNQLESYLASTDWPNADMSAAEQIMRTARDEWHKFHPCDRKALKPVEQAFESLQSQLYEQVKSAWDRNADTKRSLIEQASALLDSDTRAQVVGAKTLQQQWRGVGPVPRGLDQRLWRDFRKICDQIFENRDTAQKEWQAEEQVRQTAITQAVTQFEKELEDTHETNPGTLRQARAKLDDVVAGARLSGGDFKRVKQAEESFRVRLDEQKHAQKIEEISQLQLWDVAVTTAEIDHTPIDAPHPIFKQRLAGQPINEDLHKLVLEAEISAEIASPAEDQADRLALQVELMNAGVRNPAAQDYAKLLNRWCEAGPKSTADDPLRERFFAAIKKKAKV